MKKSILGKNWLQREINEQFVIDLSRNLQISDFLARILASRIKSLEDGEHFLNPKIKNLLPDPFHLLDMEKGTNRVLKAIKSNEKICIFADFDVDGATSSALLKNIFNNLNIPADIYVPDRITEGYGPNEAAIKKISDNGVKLIITVDCGSVAFEPLEYAATLGVDVIVIDHHISIDKLPQAVAVINPNRLDETSKHKNLAAVGVSFLFVVALISALKKEDFFNKNNIAIPNLIKQLDIVALGTVCDVMLLTGLNRAFVAQGLKVAHQRQNIGYKNLCDVAAIDQAINCYHLGFILGPRINAGGRVGKASLGARLLSTNSQIEAQNIAKELDQHNNERKVIEMTILEEAFNIAKQQECDPMLFVAKEGWHPGVIGIVASRLKDKYNKPVAVIALNKDVGKASCRSIKGVDFGIKVIEAKNRGLLIAGGGHAMAAGFTANINKLTELKDFLNKEFEKDLNKSTRHLVEFYETELTTKAANFELLEEIEKLEPYGNGNPTPIFKFSNLFVLKADILAEKHIRVLFTPTKDSTAKSKALPAIAFNSVATPIADILMSQKPYNISVYGSLKINEWQNQRSIQLHIKDIELMEMQL